MQQQARSLEAEIVERRRTEERLHAALEVAQTARAEAEAALRLRDEFPVAAAHELKTPITSLLGQSQLVLRRLARDGVIDPERMTHALQLITRQAQTLSNLLTRLLDITRIEAGRLTLERKPTDLTALVEWAVTTSSAWNGRRPITLTAPPALEATVDPVPMEQALTNLLDNAVRYSPDGGAIEVDAGVRSRRTRSRSRCGTTAWASRKKSGRSSSSASTKPTATATAAASASDCTSAARSSSCTEAASPPSSPRIGGARFVIHLLAQVHDVLMTNMPEGAPSNARRRAGWHDAPARQTDER
ncbi:MAG: histidine kinase dimerization/phospho-acceptor domain-containing protein [Dehalococcoidia bacterium]